MFTNINKVLVFDLDLTISNDCFKNNQKNKQKVLKILTNALCDQNTAVYIVTARQYEVFLKEKMKRIKSQEPFIGKKIMDEAYIDLITYSIDHDVINLIYQKNQYKPFNEWVFTSFNINDTVSRANDLLNSLHSNFGYSNDFVKYFGIHKMMQLDYIYKKENLNSWNQMTFYDDSKGNKDQWIWWYNNKDKDSKKLNFVGGDNKCVKF